MTERRRPAPWGVVFAARLLRPARRRAVSVEDLRLARWYLDAELARLGLAEAPRPPSRAARFMRYLLFYITRPPR